MLHLSRFATFGLLMLTLAPLLPAREPPATLPRFLLSWGQKGDKPGEFHSPIGIAVDKADHVYVTDFRNRRVQKFTADGKFVSAFKVTGTPSGIAVDSAGNLYVAQWDPDRLCVYDARGNLLRQWGKSGNGNGEFTSPAGVAVGPDGCVYLGDDVNRRVQKFSAEGKFLRAWGGTGTGPGQFGGEGAEKLPPRFRTSGPNFLAFDAEGNLSVTEGRAGRVQKFTRDGKFLLAWGDNGTQPGGFGGRPRNLPGPIGICFDARGKFGSVPRITGCSNSPPGGNTCAASARRGAGPGISARPTALPWTATGTSTWWTHRTIASRSSLPEPARPRMGSGDFRFLRALRWNTCCSRWYGF